jgi:ribosomal protein L11 methyltransferase
VRDIQALLHNLNAVILPGSIKDIGFTNVREEDWANSWKAYYKPVRVSERIVIKPTWEDYPSSPGELVIELDPGMAFGTGTHPTTVMCIKLLEKIIQGGETVFDIGTGSGVLAVTAAKLGAQAVKAVDIDEIAVKAASENVILNDVSDVVEVMTGNLLDRVQGQADIVVANIVADVIIKVCPDAVKAVRKGGQFIASGIIDTRKEDVLAAVQKNGLVIMEVCQEGDWVSLRATREE